MYRPARAFTTPFMILNPTIKESMGKQIKAYPTEGDVIHCSFVTYGGTEAVVNDVWTVQETANIECWYRPDINANTRLKRCEDGKLFNLLSDPEDIEYRHQFLKFKVESVKGSGNGKG